MDKRERGADGRVRFCLHGHEYTPENTTWRQGRRYCSRCLKDKYRRWYKKNAVTNIARASAWRKAHPKQARATGKKRRDRNKAELLRLFGGACIACGYADHPAALDFDHLDPATKEFSVGMKLSISLAAAIEEAKKCQLLCANCHRIKTHDSKAFQRLLLAYAA